MYTHICLSIYVFFSPLPCAGPILTRKMHTNSYRGFLDPRTCICVNKKELNLKALVGAIQTENKRLMLILG